MVRPGASACPAYHYMSPFARGRQVRYRDTHHMALRHLHTAKVNICRGSVPRAVSEVVLRAGQD